MLKVQKKMCDQCLFGPRKIVSDSRKRSIIKTCLAKDTHFNCHKQQTTKNDIKGDLVCHAFFNRYPTQMIRIAARLNAIEFVEIPAPAGGNSGEVKIKKECNHFWAECGAGWRCSWCGRLEINKPKSSPSGDKKGEGNG